MFFVMQRVLQHMVDAGVQGGSVINMASQAGRRGEALVSHYCAAKAAVISLTQSMALELIKHRINVNAIAPGYIETDYILSLPNIDTIRQNALAKNQVPFSGQPSDIAGAVAFMASEHARYITGTTLFVTGGRYG